MVKRISNQTVSILVLFLIGLAYAVNYILADDHVMNTKVGILGCVVLLSLIGLLEFKDGPFIRPHPAFWRVILALAVAYEMALIMLLLQTKDNARSIFKYIDPSLGTPLPEKSYGENCALTASHLFQHMDIFVVAHVLGWVAKSLILRDYWICWIISILFEIMEYTLEHQLPNFNECWWDHWILDVLTSNWFKSFSNF